MERTQQFVAANGSELVEMKVLNLYAGIGGNRKLWGGGISITAVEMDSEIAAIYKKNFPDDEVIVGDAHEYLLKNYKQFDFIWSSRPCITHTRARFWASKGGKYEAMYPDMGLYEEIIFLEHFFSGKWVVENVMPYYTPLITPAAEIGRHLFWCNFRLPKFNHKEEHRDHQSIGQEIYGFDLKNEKNIDKKQVLRNCVNPELGLHIFDCARNIIRETNTTQARLF